MSLFSIFVLLATAFADSKDCKWTIGNTTYDLSPLKGKVATGDDSKISTYHYTVSVCADLTDECEDIMTGQKLHGTVYQMGGEPGQQAVCWDMLARWSDDVKAVPLDASAPPNKEGLTLTFANGDPCRGSPRKTKINMLCDTEEVGTVSGYQDDDDSCLFIINFPSSHACSGGPSPSPKTTKPPGPMPAWGINGTFVGNMSTIAEDSADIPVTLKGDCSGMVAVTYESKNSPEVYQMELDVCDGYYASGTMKSESKDGATYKVNVYLVTDDTKDDPTMLEVIILEGQSPYKPVKSIAAERFQYRKGPKLEHD